VFEVAFIGLLARGADHVPAHNTGDEQ